MNNKNPKYDNDLVTLGYLKKTFKNDGEETTELAQFISKSYSSPPIPPYYKGSLLYYNHSVYRCKKDRLQGAFSLDDWEIVATDSDEFDRWVEYTYTVDKLNIENQLDEKIETYYQADDPNDWTTDIEKAKHVGDYWYKTTDNTQWRWNKLSTNPITYGWRQVNVPNAIFDLIDKKKSIYTSKPTSYKADDMWIIEDTISDSDIPVGTQENPIVKGDWVFSTTDSDSYNKNHWVKRDTNITLDYIQAHYYTTSEIESKITTINSSVDSKITQAKNEINASVAQDYTTKTEFNQKVLDYDEEIGEINTTVVDHTETISDMSININSISTAVANNYEEITDDITTYKEQVNTRFTQTEEDFTFQFNNTQTLIDALSNTESEHYQELHKYIRFVNGTIVLGEQGNELSAELSNNRLSFKQSGTEVAYISNNKLYITNSEILTELIIGNFAFVPRDNGSLSFRKVR